MGRDNSQRHAMTQRKHIRYCTVSPEIIQLAVILYVRFPLSLRNVETFCMKEALMLAMNLFRIGGIDLALN